MGNGRYRGREGAAVLRAACCVLRPGPCYCRLRVMCTGCLFTLGPSFGHELRLILYRRARWLRMYPQINKKKEVPLWITKMSTQREKKKRFEWRGVRH